MSDDLKSGSRWPYHYRGTRYHFSGDQTMWWQTFKDDLKVHVKSGHERIIKDLLPLKTLGGSFRITETGDIIAKIFNEQEKEWFPIFICEMDEAFKFEENININPVEISPGDLWPGFYDGARYSYLSGKVWWHNPEGYRQYINEKIPDDIIVELLKLKPQGGSFRITENGYVITLIPKQPLPNNLKKQWEDLSDTQQRLISTKVEHTDMLPVYIGRFHGGITLREPEDFTKPLSEEAKKTMLDFLDAFAYQGDFQGMVPTGVEPEKNIEVFHDDPEDSS